MCHISLRPLRRARCDILHIFDSRTERAQARSSRAVAHFVPFVPGAGIEHYMFSTRLRIFLIVLTDSRNISQRLRFPHERSPRAFSRAHSFCCASLLCGYTTQLEHFSKAIGDAPRAWHLVRKSYAQCTRVTQIIPPRVAPSSFHQQYLCIACAIHRYCCLHSSVARRKTAHAFAALCATPPADSAKKY